MTGSTRFLKMQTLSLTCHRLKIAIYFCLAASVYFACVKKKENPTLPDERITRVMADMFIADAATTGLTGFEKDSLSHVYYEQVLQMHGIGREEYENNLRLLADDLPRMQMVVKNAAALLDSAKAGNTE
jgi:hypothetical protein